MIVVTGLMRSGTSPLAQMLHQMGIPMGEFMRFPLHSDRAHLDWEDSVLSDRLVGEIVLGCENDMSEFFFDYIVRRRTPDSGVFGVKSPFLIPFMEQFLEAAEAANEPIGVVVTERDYEDTVESIYQQTHHLPFDEQSVCLDIQRRLADDIGRVIADRKIQIEDTWAHPRIVAGWLASVAGVDADMDVASRGIGRRGEQWA